MLYDGINILEGSDIKNATIASGNAFPANPSVGELFYISGGATPAGLYVYTNGNEWIKTLVTGEGGSLPDIITPDTFKSVTVNAQGLVTAGTNPTTLDGFGITDALPITGGTLEGNLNAPTGTKITASDAPTNGIDLVNKAYVDSAIAGLSWKQAVRVATTEDITLSGAQTIDGVSIGNGQRVLVKNQTSALQNGIYTVGTPWVRATDTDTGAEIFGASLFVQQGTINADTAWVCSNDIVPTIGTTSINFVQFNAGGSGATAGTGLSQSGNVLSVNLGAGIAALPTNEVGVEVYPNGGLMTTTNNTSSSTDSNSRLALTDTGVASGTYSGNISINIDAKGRISSASQLAASTLQSVYNSGNIILTNQENQAATFRRGSSSDADAVISILNGAGSQTARINGNGSIVAAGITSPLTSLTTSTYATPLNLTNTSGNITVNWGTSNHYRQVEPTGTITYTFIAPAGPSKLQLFIDSDGSSSAVTFNFPASVIWMGAVWSPVVNKKAILNFWYDGTNYYATGMNQA
jgi:hypothetical protein